MNEIKDLKQKEKEFKLALGYADAVIETLREPFLVLDKKLRVISSNQAFYAGFKVAKRGTIGRRLPSLGNGQWNIPTLIRLLKEVLPQKTTVTDYEVEHNFKRIGHRVMNLNARRLRIPKELAMAITGDRSTKEEEELILLAIEDITKRRRVEQQLAEAKAKDDAILASIGDAVVACDKDGRIVLFNRVAEELSGFTFKEAFGRHYGHSIRFVRERDGKPSNDFIAEVIKTGRKAVMINHTLIIKKDGLRVPVADSAAPIKDAEGKLIGCVVVFRDASKEREIDKAKTEFVSFASHQLKTPPTAIKWLTEMILEDETSKLTEKQKGYLGEVHSKNEQMIELVNSLLDVSRMELGTLAVTPVLADINPLVKGVIEGLRFQISAKSLHLAERYDKDKLVISTDANLLQIVILNLLTNAINYTPKNGEIIVEVSSKRKGDIFGKRTLVEDSAILTVADTGCGIPKRQQDKIFTKLFRADNAREKYAGGTGLGLYMVKSIIENFGGAVWFNSKENKGTTFYVAIPLSGIKTKIKGKKISQ